MSLNIPQFMSARFPDLPALSDASLAQLGWRLGMDPKDISPEKCIIDICPSWQQHQILRTGTAFDCHRLVLEDSDQSYEAFVADQHKHIKNGNTVLTREHFSIICQSRQGRDSLYEEALQAATIVGAVTLSDSAKAQANAVLGEGNWTNDSVEFVADTFQDIAKARQIYPLINALYEKYNTPLEQERLTKLLQGVFTKRLHMRHMLYTECNENGFRSIVEKIKSGEMDREAFDFFWDYWVDNIFGFRGNVSHTGSIYFTEDTFKATEALKASVLKVFTDHSLNAKDVFYDYLDQRAQWLGLNDDNYAHISQKDKRLLAHLGAMLRKFRPEDGELLVAGFKLIPAQLRKLSSIFFDDIDPQEPTVTYLPALFENAIDKRRQELESSIEINRMRVHRGVEVLNRKVDEVREILAIIDVVIGFLPFYLQSLKNYRDKREKDATFDQRLPLCFKTIANKDNIVKMFGLNPLTAGFDILKLVAPSIDEKGMLDYKEVPKNKSDLNYEDAVGAGLDVFTPQHAQGKEPRYRLRNTSGRQDRADVDAKKTTVKVH